MIPKPLSIPPVFKTGPKGVVIPEFTPGCEWTKDCPAFGPENVILTIKLEGYDLFCEDSHLWERLGEEYLEVFRGSPLPSHKLLWECYDHYLKTEKVVNTGYYVALGPGLKGNPQGSDILQLSKVSPSEGRLFIGWGHVPAIKRGPDVSVEAFYDGIRQELEQSDCEGVVFHREKPSFHPIAYAQVTRKDFGLKWPL